jgi:hypothetical protein
LTSRSLYLPGPMSGDGLARQPHDGLRLRTAESQSSPVGTWSLGRVRGLAAHLKGVTKLDASAQAAAHGDLLTTAECAAVVGLAPKTLSNYRHLPGPYVGPPFVRVGRGRGRIRYPRSAAVAWAFRQGLSVADGGES